MRTTVSVEITRTSIGNGFSNALRVASRDASPDAGLRARRRRISKAPGLSSRVFHAALSTGGINLQRDEESG